MGVDDSRPVLPVKQPETDSDSSSSLAKKKSAASPGASNTRSNKKQLILIAVLGTIAIVAITLGVTLGNGGSSGSSDKSVDAPVALETFQPNIEPFNDISVPLYTPGSINVYADEQDAQKGLSTFTKFLLNNLVQRSIGTPGFERAAFGGFNAIEEDASFVNAPGQTDSDGDQNDDQGQTEKNDINGFETNNQESNVDQADISKSDGEFIFSGFTDRLLIIEAVNGKQIIDLKMPPIGDYTPVDSSGIGTGDGEVQDQSTSRSSVYYGHAKPYIQSLMLGENRLAVVVSGYGNPYWYGGQSQRRTVISNFLSTHLRLYDTSDLDNGNLKLLGVQDIHGMYISGYMIGDVAHIVTSSNLNTYDWIVGPNERYQKQFADLTDEQYVKAVKSNAEGETILEFVEQLTGELKASTGTFPKVAELSLLVDRLSGTGGFENTLFGDGYANSVVQISSFNMENYVTVNSDGQEGDLDRLSLELSVQFLPTYWSQAYSAVNMLIIAGQGYTFDSDTGASFETTHLFGYSLNEVQTSPVLAGNVPGSMLNEYAIDFHQGFVRIATTIRQWRFIDAFIDVEPVDGGRKRRLDILEYEKVETCPEFGDAENCLDETTVNACYEIMGTGECSHVVFFRADDCAGEYACLDDIQPPPPPLCPEIDESCNDEENAQICFDLQRRGCQNIEIAEPCPLQFFCNDVSSRCPPIEEKCNNEDNARLCHALEQNGCDDISTMREFCPFQFVCSDAPRSPTPAPTERTESLTLNQLFVLKADDGESQLKVTGNVTLGKKDESFTSVRFFDTVAYAVTFLQRDPFYVIDLTEGSTPKILGELDISGFSNYLHSLNDDNTLILGVGQETTDDGTPIGLQISLFDTSTQTDPRLVDRYVLNEGGEQWSNSVAQWDEKAFRYLSINENEGRLVLPVSYSLNGSYFNGFTIFKITTSAIQKGFDIAHRMGNNNDNDNMCYYCGSRLVDRSYVIKGNVITLQGHAILSHDLGDGEFRWKRDFQSDDGQCCGW